VQFSTDNSTWTTLASGITQGWANISLPNAVGNTARIRVVPTGTASGDEQNGAFRVNIAGVVDPVGTQLIESTTTLGWQSPQGTTTVDLEYWNGQSWLPIVSGLPDIGQFNWFVPEMATNGAMVLVQFHDSTGAITGSAASNPFNIQYTLATGTPALPTRAWHVVGSKFEVYTAPITIDNVAAEPNYELYAKASHQYFFTTDRSTYLSLQAGGKWTGRGVANYLLPSQIPASVPLYRLARAKSALIDVWTTSQSEYNLLSRKGWVGEGVYGYVPMVTG
jgi:hypothetical protein